MAQPVHYSPSPARGLLEVVPSVTNPKPLTARPFKHLETPPYQALCLTYIAHIALSARSAHLARNGKPYGY